MNGIAFGMSSAFQLIKEGEPFDICYSIEENLYNGNPTVQLVIRDIAPSE